MTVFESYKVIPEFPDYMISSFGRVYNHKYNRWMDRSPIQSGELTVGLTKDGVQHRRSVKVLVANAFVPGRDDLFDTPVLLDQNPTNLHADNIVWRPRSFAWKYSQQFDDPPPWAYQGPVMDLNTRVHYENLIEAAMSLGLLIADIRMNMLHKRPVFPMNAMFAFR